MAATASAVESSGWWRLGRLLFDFASINVKLCRSKLPLPSLFYFFAPAVSVAHSTDFSYVMLINMANHFMMNYSLYGGLSFKNQFYSFYTEHLLSSYFLITFIWHMKSLYHDPVFAVEAIASLLSLPIFGLCWNGKGQDEFFQVHWRKGK